MSKKEKNIPDKDRESIKRIVNGVFLAEHLALEKYKIDKRLKNKEITPDEYVDYVVDAFIGEFPDTIEH